VKKYLDPNTRESIIEKHGPIKDWNTSEVTNMSHMFSDASTFNQNISGWDICSVTKIDSMYTNSVLDNNKRPTCP